MKIGSSVKNNFLHQKHIPIIKFSIVLIYSIFISSCSDSSLNTISLGGTTMGTTYSIKIVPTKNKFEPTNIQSEIDIILLNVNKQMSTYIKDSEISVFNSSDDTSWIEVSKDFAKVINYAMEISEHTDNYYDITIGPIVNLWGFGPEAVPMIVPKDSAISHVKLNTGIQYLTIDLQTSRIKKNIAELYCDLSSIAKGFGVDKVSMLLDEIDIDRYMVEIGGEVRTKGKNAKNENWKIGISTPLSNGLQKIVSISNLSVATSGDYLNYFEKNGVRYSHLINPKTGKPINHNLASVTVVHPQCAKADAYATAINVMGPKIGYKFALEKKLPIFMIVREGNSFIEKMTPQFEEYIFEGKL